jgi:hypothetical protein
MSNKPNMNAGRGIDKSIRNLQVLFGRGRAEVQAKGIGPYHATVKHDDWCPGLKKRSMIWCECNPEIDINPW